MCWSVEGLKFETSTHISVGFVWQPIKRSTLTVDAYNIAIDDRIVLGDLVTRDAVAGNAAATAVLNQLGVNGISFFSNAVNTSTRGIDIIYSHYMPFARGDLDITAALNFNNIFDETPRELDAMDVLNLISAGPNNGFRFPIRAVPYGFNGASYYMKLAFNL